MDLNSLGWSNVTLSERGLPLVHVTNNEDKTACFAVYSRRKDRMSVGLAYEVEFTSDFVTWHSTPHDPAVLAEDGILEVVSIPFPASITNHATGFFRVIVYSENTRN